MASDRTYSAKSWAAVTPSDSAFLEPTPVALYAGGAGDIVAQGANAVNTTFAVTAGAVLPIQPRQVLSTGTTATGIVGLYN